MSDTVKAEDPASEPRVPSCSAARSALLRRPAGVKEEGRGEMKACAKAAGERLPLVRAPSTSQPLARRYYYLSLSLPGQFSFACSLIVRCPRFIILICYKHYQLFNYVYRNKNCHVGVYPSSMSCSASAHKHATAQYRSQSIVPPGSGTGLHSSNTL